MNIKYAAGMQGVHDVAGAFGIAKVAMCCTCVTFL